jgi:quercetin dioxygenase-like cupin family protein
MASITIRSPEDTPAVVTGDVMPPGPHRDKFDEAELRNTVRLYHRGGPDTIQMFEVEVQPNDGPRPHAHAEDEIIFVLSGELHFGARVLTAGSSVHIPGLTLYSFRAGPEGARFLNTRPRADATYITKDELMEMRKETASASGDR